MEFLVEFEINVPEGTPSAKLIEREDAETSAAAKFAADGHLLRVWKRTASAGEPTVVGLYRANSKLELDDLLRALPLYDWMNISVTPLESHPNDPEIARSGSLEKDPSAIHLPAPHLSLVYRLEAALGQPVELGETAFGPRRIVPLTGGTFTSRYKADSRLKAE